MPWNAEENDENSGDERANEVVSRGDADGLLRGIFSAICCFLDGDSSCWSHYDHISVWQRSGCGVRCVERKSTYTNDPSSFDGIGFPSSHLSLIIFVELDPDTDAGGLVICMTP